MSLLKGLRQLETAYQTKDWNLVFSAYEEIAGEPLEIQDSDNIEPDGMAMVVDCKENKKTIKKLETSGEEYILVGETTKRRGRPKKGSQGGIVHKEDTVVTVLSPGTSTTIGEVKKKTGTEVKWSGNSFVDDKSECLDDIPIDKILKKGKGGKGWKAPPKRPKHQYATVACKTCSQNFQVDPSVLTENPLCNRCLSKKARG